MTLNYLLILSIGLEKFKYCFTTFKKNNSDTEFSNIDIYKVTKQDKELFKFLDKLLSININDKDGFINISVTSKIKSVPAQITKKCSNYFTK